MGRFLTHWLITAVALGVTAWILPGVQVASPLALAAAGVVLGFVNAIIRPALVILTLPLTLLTLGLFYFVVNGLAFALTAWVVPGFSVSTVPSAILGALLVSLFSWFMGASGHEQRQERE